MRRRARNEHDKLSPGQIIGDFAERGGKLRQRRRMNPCHQHLLGLLVDRVLPVAVEIGVRMRGSRRDARPFRPDMAGEQPQIARGALRCLQIVDPVEPAPPQLPAQCPPIRQRGRPRPRIDQHLVETAEPGRETGKRRGRQQCDVVARVTPADCRERPERLDKIAERAEPDHQDTAPRGRSPRRHESRPPPRQSVEIDLGGESLECREHRGVHTLIGSAARREQPVDQIARHSSDGSVFRAIGRQKLQRHPTAEPRRD